MNNFPCESKLTRLTTGHYVFERGGYKAAGHLNAVRDKMLECLEHTEVDFAIQDMLEQCNDSAHFGMNGYYLYSKCSTEGIKQ